MQPHEERVVIELNQLKERRYKLGLFIGGNVFLGLPAGEQERLTRQFKIMGEYADVLQERIACFPK